MSRYIVPDDFLEYSKNQIATNNGKPKRLSYEELTEGMFDSPYENMINEELESTGMSRYSKPILDESRYRTRREVDAAREGAESAVASARQKMAMRGGVNSGARERLAQKGADIATRATMDTRAKGLSTELGLRSADAKYKQGLMRGMLDLAEQRRKEKLGYELDTYDKDMLAWATEREVEERKRLAQNSGGLFNQGGFLGLGV